MGLLDDAIREHLELKRRSGADPGDVAREQREALEDPLDPEAGRLEDPSPPGSAAAPQLAADAAASHLLEETAELDMQSLLDQRADAADLAEMSAGSTGAAPPVDPAANAAAGEEPLQWEAPGEGMRGHTSEAAGPAPVPQEALSGGDVEHVHPPAEDLVAGMSDGAHDAQEQDRLWPEPNAPQDVDADK